MAEEAKIVDLQQERNLERGDDFGARSRRLLEAQCKVDAEVFALAANQARQAKAAAERSLALLESQLSYQSTGRMQADKIDKRLRKLLNLSAAAVEQLQILSHPDSLIPPEDRKTRKKPE